MFLEDVEDGKAAPCRGRTARGVEQRPAHASPTGRRRDHQAGDDGQALGGAAGGPSGQFHHRTGAPGVQGDVANDVGSVDRDPRIQRVRDDDEISELADHVLRVVVTTTDELRQSHAFVDVVSRSGSHLHGFSMSQLTPGTTGALGLEERKSSS